MESLSRVTLASSTLSRRAEVIERAAPCNCLYELGILILSLVKLVVGSAKADYFDVQGIRVEEVGTMLLCSAECKQIFYCNSWLTA